MSISSELIKKAVARITKLAQDPFVLKPLPTPKPVPLPPVRTVLRPTMESTMRQPQQLRNPMDLLGPRRSQAFKYVTVPGQGTVRSPVSMDQRVGVEYAPRAEAQTPLTQGDVGPNSLRDYMMRTPPPSSSWDPYILDMRRLKERIYGGDFASEVATADQYNKAQGIPFRMSNYLRSRPRFSKNDARSYYGAPRAGRPYGWIGLGAGAGVDLGGGINLPSIGPLSRRSATTLGASGFKPSDQSTVSGSLFHEMAHAAASLGRENPWIYKNYGSKVRDLRRQQTEELGRLTGSKRNRKVMEIDKTQATYPELVGAEIVPPATALQHYKWQTEGKRITSPQEFDAFVKPYENLSDARLEKAMEKLPLEVKRLLRYRQRLKQRPKRKQLMDDILKKILPGIVRKPLFGGPTPA